MAETTGSTPVEEKKVEEDKTVKPAVEEKKPEGKPSDAATAAQEEKKENEVNGNAESSNDTASKEDEENAAAVAAKCTLSEDVIEKLRTQLDFYFSDPNLRRDAFMNSEIAKCEEGIEATTFLRFNRVRDMGVTARESVVKAVERSKHLTLNADKTRIKRITPYDRSRDSEEAVIKRSLFVSGFPENIGLDECTALIGNVVGRDKLAFVKMRRQYGKFQGSCFVEFTSDADAAAALERKEKFLRPDGKQIEVVTTMKDFLDNGEPRVAKRPRDKDHKPFTVEYVKDTVVSVTGVPEGTKRDDLKAAATGERDTKSVQYVEFYLGSDDAQIRFTDAESCKDGLKLLQEAEFGDAKVKLKSVTLLQGDDEQKYWDKLKEEMAAKQKKRKSSDRNKGKNRSNWRGRGRNRNR